jgi:hypothetical protein
MKTAAVGVVHRVAIAICIVLTLAFGVSCLCASTMMNLPMLRHISAPFAHAMINAVAPKEAKATPDKIHPRGDLFRAQRELVLPERMFHKSFARNQERINCALKTVGNAKSHADEHGQDCSDRALHRTALEPDE